MIKEVDQRIGNPKRDAKKVDEIRRVPKVFLKDETASVPEKRQKVNSGLEPYSGPWGRAQAAHLLRRTLFGLRKSELDLVSDMTMTEAVDMLLTPEATPPPPVNNYNSSQYNNSGNDPDVPFGTTWIEAAYHGDFEGMRIYSLKSWIIDQILEQQMSIHQKLNLFWHNLLPTEMWGIFYAKTSYQYWRMIHENAFGDYQAFIRKLTLDPCMLFYLNGTYNNKDAPDENYARELQELFCLGKGPDSEYTESDVQAAARVLTGWSVDWTTIFEEGPATSVFYSWNHHTGDKTFSSFYGDQTITGRSGKEGAEELDELLEMIFANEEVSRYICRRLYNFFVYHEIDEVTEQNVILPLAQIFRDNHYQIAPVLSAVFRSAHFYDEANHGAYIKNPADHHLGMWRTLELPEKAFAAISEENKLLRNMYVNWNMANRGMTIGDPPNVAGWQAYYQKPSYDRMWLSSDTILSRIRMQDDLIYNDGLWGLQFINQSLINFIEDFNDPQDAQSLVLEAQELLLGIKPEENVIDSLMSILEPDQNNPEWTNHWNSYMMDPDNEMKKSTVEARLRSLFQRMLQMGEFQLM